MPQTHGLHWRVHGGLDGGSLCSRAPIARDLREHSPRKSMEIFEALRHHLVPQLNKNTPMLQRQKRLDVKLAVVGVMLFVPLLVSMFEGL